MTNQKKSGVDTRSDTQPPNPALLPAGEADPSGDDEEMNPIRELLLEFLAWRKKTGQEPPPITAEDIREAERMLADPTDEERAEGLRALERYRERQKKESQDRTDP